MNRRRTQSVGPQALRELVSRLFPGAQIVEVKPLGADDKADSATAKAGGYGKPLRITLRTANGRRVLVLHTASANEFGHDRRADRADEMLLAYDTFDTLPRHVRALDVGAIAGDGTYRSLRDVGEFYLLTNYAPGRLYAEDLRRIAREGARPLDLARLEALSRYLVELHAVKVDNPIAYQRAIRDLVGHGEGVFGLIDSYPDDVPAAPPERLKAIERQVVDWRWRLRRRATRLCRTHGDFHPFNVVFGQGTEFTLLDASRGCLGDPCDDLMAMAVNFVFFALDTPGAWHRGLRTLWYRFFDVYRAERDEGRLLEAAAPFFAWRSLVVANPKWYPDLSAGARDRLLSLAEGFLGAERLDPARADLVFTGAPSPAAETHAMSEASV